MTGNEAKELAARALHCGAISAEAYAGVVQITFEAVDNSFREIGFASISISESGLSIQELRNSRTTAALRWERKLAKVLEYLNELHSGITQLKVA